MTGEGVGAAEGKDADRCRGMMCEALDDLVQCAITAAGEDEVGARGDCIGGLCTSRSRAMSCDDLNLDAMAEQHVRGALEHAYAGAAAASGVRVEDEGRASHALRLLLLEEPALVETSWTGGGVVWSCSGGGPPGARVG